MCFFFFLFLLNCFQWERKPSFPPIFFQYSTGCTLEFRQLIGKTALILLTIISLSFEHDIIDHLKFHSFDNLFVYPIYLFILSVNYYFYIWFDYSSYFFSRFGFHLFTYKRWDSKISKWKLVCRLRVN